MGGIACSHCHGPDTRVRSQEWIVRAVLEGITPAETWGRPRTVEGQQRTAGARVSDRSRDERTRVSPHASVMV
jgi:hypothetical protein